MMRATGAKLRMLASEAVALALVPLGVVCGGEDEECGDGDDMALAAGLRLRLLRHRSVLTGSVLLQSATDRRSNGSGARLEGM
jgi:hypothetical protein